MSRFYSIFYRTSSFYIFNKKGSLRLFVLFSFGDFNNGFIHLQEDIVPSWCGGLTRRFDISDVRTTKQPPLHPPPPRSHCVRLACLCHFVIVLPIHSSLSLILSAPSLFLDFLLHSYLPITFPLRCRSVSSSLCLSSV